MAMNQPNLPRRQNFFQRHRRLLWWLLALAVIVLLTLLWHTHKKHQHQEDEQNKPPSVNIVKPKSAPKETTLTLPGTIQAIQETSIYARTNGYLTRWYHDIGDSVKKGELLADIDTPDIDQQLIQTKGVLRQAQANLELAKITAERWKALLKENAVSKQETDEKVASYQALLATAESAQADVGRLTYLQSFKKLTAPFDGVVTERTVDNGALINSGSAGSRELFKVAQMDTVKIYVGVPQSQARAIQPGIEVQLLLNEFSDRQFTGKVARSSRAIDPVARTLLTEIDIPNPNRALLPGMYAQAKFHFPATERSLIVPSNVIVIHTDEPKILLVDDDNKLHFTNVVIGRDFGQEMEILDGLDEDARIVNNPNDALVEGETVRIEEKKQAAPKAPKEEGNKDKKDKKDEDKKNSDSDKNDKKAEKKPKDKKKDEGEAKPKDEGNVNKDDNGKNLGDSGSNRDKATLDSNDKLPDAYKKKPGQHDKGGDSGTKDDSDKGDASKQKNAPGNDDRGKGGSS